MLESIDWKKNLTYVIATFLFFFLFQALFTFLSGGTSLLALSLGAFKFGEATLFAIIPTAVVAIFAFGFDIMKVGIEKAVNSSYSNKILIQNSKNQTINQSKPITLANKNFNDKKADPMILNYVKYNLEQKKINKNKLPLQLPLNLLK